MRYRVDFIFGLFLSLPKYMLIDIREREKEGEKEGEKHRCERETLISCSSTHPSRGPNTLDMHPDW